ncbi:Uncharacterised protein [Klebsiella pneumoniae]|nr:Uncharacterised protein [Klebsiella pneumoniae]
MRITQTVFAVDIVQQACPFRAQRAAAHRMVRVPFDMVDRFFGVFRAVAEAIHQQPTADRTVCAGVADLFRTQQFEIACLSQRHFRGKAQGGGGSSGHTACADLKELSAADVHCIPPCRMLIHRAEETNSKIPGKFASNQGGKPSPP